MLKITENNLKKAEYWWNTNNSTQKIRIMESNRKRKALDLEEYRNKIAI